MSIRQNRYDSRPIITDNDCTRDIIVTTVISWERTLLIYMSFYDKSCSTFRTNVLLFISAKSYKPTM